MATQESNIPQGSGNGSGGSEQTNGQTENFEGQDGGQDTSGTSTAGDGQGQEGQSPFAFRHPSLAGRQPEEVERYVSLLESAVREQGQQLNRQPPPAAAAPQEKPQLSSDDYWQDPIRAIRSVVDEAIAPFRQDMVASRQQSARSTLRERFPDFGRYEPLIDQMLQSQGVTDGGNEQLLQMIYFAVKGREATMGPLTGEGGQGPSVPPPQTERQNHHQQTQSAMSHADQRPASAAPPQHRPSNAPLPQQRTGQQQRRQLTEAERRLAREGGMTPEQYLDWLEVPSDEVVTSDIGRPQPQGGQNG